MNQYVEQMILSASPVEIVNLLYQRAIRGVRDAREHFAAGRIAERTRAINSAWAVFAELLSSLEFDAAPEMAGRLRDLYHYMQSLLVASNLDQDAAPLSEVLMLLTTMAEGWAGILEQEKRRYETPEWAQISAAESESSRYAVSA